MSFGWTGQILRVDLSKKESTTEDTEPYARSFIGGRGINVKVIYDEVGPKVSPYDPENRLCFGPGPLGGTLAPGSSRTTVTTMSPRGLIVSSSKGGHIGAAIRHAGYDNIIIQGQSDKPVYLYINDDSVEVKDASHIWGKDTWEAQQMIKSELGDSVEIMCIGPGGENLVNFGCILTGVELGSAAGRGGMGAVMGSKRLKAIAARGTRGVKIANLEEFITASEQAREWIIEDPSTKSMKEAGDEGQLDELYDNGCFIFGNWEGDVNWDEQGKFGDAKEFWEHYGTGKYGCHGCPVAHFTAFNIPGVGTAKTRCIGWMTFGGPVWNNDRRLMVHASSICDRYGLDYCSTGMSISFLMELYHRGIITEKDTDGIAMKRGDEKAIISTIHKIGKQEGFGKLFRDGVLGAAKTIGKGAEDCAIVVKGLEMYPQECRAYRAQALGAAVGTKDVQDNQSTVEYRWIYEKEPMEKRATELYGRKDAAIPNAYEDKALAVFDAGNQITVSDMLGVCKYLIPYFITGSLEVPAKLLSLATGRDTTEDELLFAAQRAITLERAFNVIRGIRRKDDTLPKRLFSTAAPGGPFKGEGIDKKKFNKMVDEYYQLRGWDEDGVPTEETFKKFGLSSELKVFKKRLGRTDVRLKSPEQ
ncbi:aldehyde ferredoxin oxidoreductase family protein [Chloroflexota bacterium]